ncbi:hypothetical protein L1987_36784 [Smallanthus sonchifolius]|uniref:Uncharacterized protein n=1 Tax=Smallanthus sonchifolius TaxID=185202 RepID=A0ACB9HFW8_9ASTR|nr:hypothetical protein L1987_36784 [Smallanthus sonchifolius]
MNMAQSSSFSRAIYSEIEEIGWEHLARLAEDLSFVTFRVVDKKERVHVLEILLDKSYPNCPPSVSADVPYLFNLEWSTNSRLKDVVKQFRQYSSLGPPGIEKNDQPIECGICYSQFLPVDDEFGPKSGGRTDYTCENSTCSKAFHSVCLGDWLRSITTTRQSFDVLFGNCPYCSQPVAVKIGTRK